MRRDFTDERALLRSGHRRGHRLRGRPRRPERAPHAHHRRPGDPHARGPGAHPARRPFAARLGFAIEPETYAAMRRHAGELAQCAPPRVLEEIFKLLRCGGSARAFALLRACGALPVILPALGAAHERWDEAQRKSFIAHLGALDRLVRSGAALSEVVLLGALLMHLVGPRTGATPPPPRRSWSELVQTSRLPRKVAEGIRLALYGAAHLPRAAAPGRGGDGAAAAAGVRPASPGSPTRSSSSSSRWRPPARGWSPEPLARRGRAGPPRPPRRRGGRRRPRAGAPHAAHRRGRRWRRRLPAGAWHQAAGPGPPGRTPALRAQARGAQARGAQARGAQARGAQARRAAPRGGASRSRCGRGPAGRRRRRGARGGRSAATGRGGLDGEAGDEVDGAGDEVEVEAGLAPAAGGTASPGGQKKRRRHRGGRRRRRRGAGASGPEGGSATAAAGRGLESRWKPGALTDPTPFDRTRRPCPASASTSTKARYKRILLKLSGEALMGERQVRHRPEDAEAIAQEVKDCIDLRSRWPSSSAAATSSAAWPAPPRAWTGPAPTTWACWPPSSTPWRCRTPWRRSASTPGCSPPSRCTRSPSPTSAAAPSATWRRGGW